MQRLNLMPIEKLALAVGGWAILAVAAFFFHEVAFVACVVMLVNKGLEFKFVYENTRYSESDVIEYGSYGDDNPGQSCEMDYLPGLGADWEGSVRADLSESESRWNKRILE